jgi:hypothetical protein
MMKRLLTLSAAALAIAACHKAATPAAGSEAVSNITTLDANAMPEDANITAVPPDDGDAPGDVETNK